MYILQIVQSFNFDVRLSTAFILKLWSRVQIGGGAEWVEVMEFPGVLKKEHVEIPGVSSKRSGISSSDRGKVVPHNFVGEVLLSLEFPGVN